MALPVDNIEVQTNGTFAVSFEMSAWADLYDLTEGTFHSQLRETIASPVVLLEWSSAKGNISYNQTLANGWIAFASNPLNGQTITIGSTEIAFIEAGPAVGNQIVIAGNLPATLTSLLSFLSASLDADIVKCTYKIVSTTLNVEYKTAGTLGNLFAIATGVADSTISGATLSGGGGILTMLADINQISEFSGAYYYDVRYETSSAIAPLFGGTITFTQGVTRDNQD